MPTLNLYLIRHGIAVERSDDVDDRGRSLTVEGIKKTRDIAHKLHKLGLKFDLLQTSPLLRAIQTAEIFAKTFNTPLQVSELLAPDASNQNFKKWMRWLLTYQDLAQDRGQDLDREKTQGISLGIIGHEPDLSAWAELLIFGEARGSLILKKTGIIGITIPEQGLPIGNSLLFLLIPPKLMS